MHTIIMVSHHPHQDKLLNNTVVLAATRPLGFSNEFMMAAPGAPFMARLVQRLPGWATTFGTKYPTVMFSTGPMFVTVQHAVYGRAREEVRCMGIQCTATIVLHQVVMMRDDLYGKFSFNASTAYLNHHPGSSWHGEDSAIVFWLYRHLVWLARVGMLVLLCSTMAALWVRLRQRVAPPSQTCVYKTKLCIV